jgi:hypothetical protein
LGQLLGEGDNWQDFAARHAATGVNRRVRIYPYARAATPEARDRLARTARREFRVLEGVEHAGIQRVFDALLLPPIPVVDQAERVDHPLNAEQRVAADWRGAAYVVEAGPGTGKTQTLTARVERLLADNVDPRRILVLTFSNKAAGEMADRIARKHREAAAAMWIGTFHAFGLDLIRRFHTELGEGFAITGIKRQRTEALERVSHGTQEQIAVLVRLAMGAMLAEQGNAAPIILDDALVYCDDDGIQRMFDALSRAGRHQQIIVLTCRLRSFGPLGGRTLQIRTDGDSPSVLLV